MKVLKPGKPIKATMRVTCKVCEAELEIDGFDLKNTDESKEFWNSTYFFICPCCRKKNRIKFSDLSHDVCSYLKSQSKKLTTLDKIYRGWLIF